jgi:DNA-binding LacI/PurR family transcriptional regulator
MANLTLKRSSLVAQVADTLRLEILRGTWPEWIPSERELSQTLHVSRATFRSSLAMLRRENLVEAVPRRGARVNRIAVSKVRRSAPRDRSIGILVPDVMGHLRPLSSLMIDALKSELFDLKVHVDIHCSPAMYLSHSRSAFEKFTDKNRHDCWFVIGSSESIQRWFLEKQLPCVIIGSLYPGISLPSMDLDYRAICRHAVGKLIALGHRRLAFFNRGTCFAGDLESDAGILEGSRATSHSDVEVRTVYHQDSRETVTRLVRSLFASASRPTGLLVANSYSYLSVATSVMQLGLRIPEDVSLISRDDDPFLAHINPDPARYLTNDADGLARKCMTLLRPLLEGGTAKLDPIRVLPRFNSGASCRAI